MIKHSKFDTVVNTGFGVALAILVVIGFLYYRNVTAMTDFEQMEERSYKVIVELEGLVSTMKDVEIGELAFVMTGKEDVLEPYRAALKRIEQHLATLKDLTSRHPTHRDRVLQIERLIRPKLAEVADTIAIRKERGFQAAYRQEFTHQHEQLMDEILRQLAEGKGVVGKHLNRRKMLKEASTRNVISAFFAGTALSFALLLTIFLLLRRDITERKRAEEKFRGLLESAPEAVVIVNDRGEIYIVNSQAEKLFGYGREELYGQKVEMLVPERYRDGHVRHRTDYFLSPRVRRMGTGAELFGLCKDGRVFPADISLSPLSTDEGVLVIASVRDVTERKRADEALRKSELKFFKVFHAAPALIGISTLQEGRFIDINETALQTLGYRRDEVIGRTPQELKILEGPSERVRVLQELEEQGSVKNLEVRFRGKAGQILTGLFSAEFIELEGERYMLSLVRDITARKRAEEVVEQLNADLTARAAELEEVNRELETFNYTVAHDLRQPLNVINSYCQVIGELCGEGLDKQCRGYLRETYEGTLRMNGLIDALLNFSRMARVELHREAVDLSAMAHAVAVELRMAEPERRVELHINRGMHVHGDANLLRLVLVNLLGNAWKYTGVREEGVIEVGVAIVDGKPVCFVRDNGPGFDMADADKLFTPFQRLAGAEEYRGFGIGLATVERIIRRHGGRIWAAGEPGKGATFYFALPEGDATS